MRLALFLGLSITAGCLEVDPYACQSATNCFDHTRQGYCIPSSLGPSYCAYDDQICPSHRRWSQAAAASLAGQCVAELLDAGIPDHSIVDMTVSQIDSAQTDSSMDLSVPQLKPVNFAVSVNYKSHTAPNDLDIGDFNGDTKLDLVTANFSSDDVSVLLGVGNGTFQMAINTAASSGPVAVRRGDF